MSNERLPGQEVSWIDTASVLNSTGLYMKPKEDVVTSALRLLVSLEDCPSITITVQDSSGDYSAALATLRLDGYEMILQHSTEQRTTSVILQRTGSWER